MKLILSLVMSLALAATATAAPVSTPAELAAEITASKGGSILLAPGDYGTLELSDRAFPEPLILASADPAKPARFTGITFSRVSNVRLVALDIGRDRGAEPYWGRILDLRDSTALAIEGGAIHGSRDGNASNDMWGLYATRVIGLRVSRVTFEELENGAVIEDSSDLTFESNDLRMIAADGLDIPGMSNARIVGNSFTDFRPSPGSHPDAIQCWTARKAAGCRNVLIADNRVRGSAGYEMQGLMFGDEDSLHLKGAGHAGIRVERNVILHSAWNAMAFDRIDGLTLTDNLVLTAPGAPMTPKVYSAGAATLTGNVAPAFVINGQHGTPSGNRLPTAGDAALDAASAAWTARMRTPADPRIAEREGLRISIPAETAMRDSLTRKLTRDRARLKAIDKALGI